MLNIVLLIIKSDSKVEAYKMLELMRKGEFEKETYQEISHKMDLVDDTFTKLEKEFGMFDKLLKPTPFDE